MKKFKFLKCTLITLFLISTSIGFFMYTAHWITSRRLSVIQLREKLGIDSLEVHKVVTKDGFILTLHRILPNQEKPKGIVLLHHGLFEDSFVWLLSHHRNSLPLQLSALGYEVWLGNSRGNFFGQEHVHYTTEDPEFWEWSFHDMARYDFPAQIHYIQRHTTHVRYHKSDDHAHHHDERIIFVGQSQGATQALVGLSLQPQLKRSISALIALAPGLCVRFPKHAAIEMLFESIASGSPLFGRHQFQLTFDAFRFWVPDAILGPAGEELMHWLEFSKQDVDDTFRLWLYSHIPSGTTSLLNMKHWIQLTKRGVFAPFDNEIASLNYKDYQSAETPPPPYPLHKLHDLPIHLYLAGEDNIIDRQCTIDMLPHASVFVQEGFSHADFLWSASTPEKVFPSIIQQILDVSKDK
mmetsp:Transcript_15368/g.23010  ORF Transcript_15368/g.23010 Transcript_15368/m.23010 type:complete len:409 (-) Transcript_15368:37-1263(-)